MRFLLINQSIHGAVTVRGARLRNSLEFNDCEDRFGLSTFVNDRQQMIGKNPCLRH